ncbi:retrotransposon protein, putative, ty1-copia subclass [Tanacetum coccineum]
MIRPETVKLLILYWMTYIEYGCSKLRLEMDAAAQNTNNTTIRSIFLAKKLTGLNFTIWYCNLRIVLMYEKKMKFVEQPTGPTPDPETADPDTFDNLFLNSLNKDYDHFVQNYNMHSMGKTIAELHAMLKIYAKKGQEETERVRTKGKNKLAYAPKPKIPPTSKRDNLAKDSVCHHCKEVGHWRRNCLSYQAKLKKRKNASVASTSGIFTIELYAFPNKIWVYDTACGTYICNTFQGLRGSKKLKHRALSLYMSNGMRAVVQTIRSFDLVLPSGLIIVLDNCHFTPTITRGVVLISSLVNNGYIHTFTNYGISVSKDDVFYFNAIPCDGIYEIDMHNLYPNKRMDKLQRDGILQPTHDESLEKCKSCIFGKMAHKPFPHQVERAKDLLGLIHTNVCGPFRTVSREGTNYFITFTDDFSRYGYVYLMKHKHEVFETFKVFQNEVENQLGKKIKVIRSYQGGEYLSHEFVNHMKSCGIVSQLTPPYTPHHNRVSKRRNQTLLDMVRSMMHLTTLPKFFWGYALEFAARILNMVPTKKVERTPYEIWHGKAPNLMVQEASGSYGLLESSRSDGGLELIQEEDPQPSENTSKVHNKVTPIEEYELEDLNEPPNYKAALSDPEFDKWFEAMNTKMQSMKDNQVWVLVDLPANGQTIRNIRDIRTLLAIVAFYDYEIWKMDVKNAFLNGHQSEDHIEVGIKDLGEAACTLGIKIICDRSVRLIALTQSAYLEKILKKLWMENSKNGYTPMIEKPNYRKSQCAKTYAKQSITAMSSTEAEYNAATEASMEAVWMRKFIDGLGNVVPSNKRPMEMLCDNEHAIAITNVPIILKGCRHFQRKYHYICEVI